MKPNGFVWHPGSKVWQRPGPDGRQAVERFRAAVDRDGQAVLTFSDYDPSLRRGSIADEAAALLSGRSRAGGRGGYFDDDLDDAAYVAALDAATGSSSRQLAQLSQSIRGAATQQTPPRQAPGTLWQSAPDEVEGWPFESWRPLLGHAAPAGGNAPRPLAEPRAPAWSEAPPGPLAPVTSAGARHALALPQARISSGAAKRQLDFTDEDLEDADFLAQVAQAEREAAKRPRR